MFHKKLVGLSILIIIIINNQISYSYNVVNFYGKERYVVIGNKLNVRNKMSINSKVIFQLNYGEIVYLIKKSTKKNIINNKKGSWLKIIIPKTIINKRKKFDNSKGNIVGWIFDYYVATPDKFKKVKNWDLHKEINTGIGDYQHKFRFIDDGRFTLYVPIYHGSLKEKSKECRIEYKGVFNNNDNECIIKGHLYKYKKIYWAKINSDSSLGYIYFIIDSNRKIHIAIESIFSLFEMSEH